MIDRASGEERGRLDDGAWASSREERPGYVLQTTGDAILCWPERGLLRACDHEGRERWRLQLDPQAVPGGGPVAVTPGFVASDDHLVCIGDEG